MGVSEDLRVLLRDFERGDQAAVRALVLEGLREQWGDVCRASLTDVTPDVCRPGR